LKPHAWAISAYVAPARRSSTTFASRASRSILFISFTPCVRSCCEHSYYIRTAAGMSSRNSDRGGCRTIVGPACRELLGRTVRAHCRAAAADRGGGGPATAARRRGGAVAGGETWNPG